MPVLCSFTDLQSISLLLYKSSSEFWFKTYPYVYSKSMFSSSFSEDNFYQSLLSSFCSEHSIDLKDCDVLMTGFLEAPQLGIPVKLTKSLYEVVASIKDLYPVLINNTSIFTPDFCLAATALKVHHEHPEFSDIDEDNYYANLELYPQVTSNDISSQIDLDSNVSMMVDAKCIFPAGSHLVFCGSRFSHKQLFPELDPLLMLSVIRGHGIYDLKKDSQNVLILASLLNIHDQKITIPVTNENIGTAVVSPSAVECMLQPDNGPSQLVALEKGKTLVVPLLQGERVKMMVKSRHLGTTEHIFVGNGLGLIVDTREEKHIRSQDIGSFSASLKNFTEAKGN